MADPGDGRPEAGGGARRALFEELWVEALGIAGEGTLVATGGCMLPTLAPGDRVVVERPAADRYRPGDVVVYRGAQSLVAHRMLATFNSGRTAYVVHRGDNSSVRGVLPRSHLLGRVAAVVRSDGTREPVVSLPPPALRRLWYSSVAALRHQIRSLLNRLSA